MTRINVGEKMPNFAFDTGYAPNKQLSDYLGGKTVVWVLRYIGCPTCSYTAYLINNRYDEFLAKNAKVLMVMQSDPKHIQDYLGERNIDLKFDIVADTEMKIYKELEILPAKDMQSMMGNADPEEMKKKFGAIREAGFTHGDYEGDELQLPALFILDEAGTVTYAHYAENGMDMPSVDEVLEML
jgi:peroxiredoxin